MSKTLRSQILIVEVYRFALPFNLNYYKNKNKKLYGDFKIHSKNHLKRPDEGEKTVDQYSIH